MLPLMVWKLVSMPPIPTVGDVVLTSAFGFFLHRFLRLAFRTNENHLTAVSNHINNVVMGFLKQFSRSVEDR